MKDSQASKKKMLKYKLVLKVLGKRWESQGNSLLKALQNLKPTWDQIKGKGILEVYVSGMKKHERLFTMSVIRKIISNKVVTQHWAKNLEFLIQEKNQTNIPEKTEIKQ